MVFTGEIAEIPIGYDGFTGNKNLSQVLPSQLLQAESMRYSSGNIERDGGAAKYNSSAISGTPKIIGGHDWHPDSVTQRMVVITDAGDILKDSGGGTFSDTLKSGLTVSGIVPMFIEGGDESLADTSKLFIFTESNQVQVLDGDGATVADIATPPADWSSGNFPITGINHAQRMWGFMGHRAYYSTLADQEDFVGSGSGSVVVYPGEGERIVAAYSFKQFIICFKFPKGIYLIDTSDLVDTTTWGVSRQNREIGMSSPQPIFAIETADNAEEIIFMDQVGRLHGLSGVTEFKFGSRNLSSVSYLDEWIRNNANFSLMSNIRGVYYPKRNEAHFLLAGLGSTSLNLRLVADFNDITSIRFWYSFRDELEALWSRKDNDGIQILYGGGNVGFVWSLDEDQTDKDGLGYNTIVQTAHMDFSFLDPVLSTVRKNGKFLELVVDPTGNWDLSVDIIWDGMLEETVQFNMGTTGSALGSFELGTDALAGDQVLNKKRRIHGSGRRLSFVFRQSGANQEFSVSKALLHFTRGNQEL